MKVIHGDCLNELPKIDDNSIDMIYIDPPFFTNKTQKLKGYFYEDIWNNSEEYSKFLYDRIVKMKRVLKDTGSIFVHCDTNSNYIIRNIMNI